MEPVPNINGTRSGVMSDEEKARYIRRAKLKELNANPQSTGACCLVVCIDQPKLKGLRIIKTRLVVEKTYGSDQTYAPVHWH